jgi:phosphatidate cytidylyltransferase
VRQWDSHKQRLVTGIALALPLVGILAFGPYWSWVLLVGVAAALALQEFHGLVFQQELPMPWRVFHIVAGLGLVAGTAAGGSAGLHLALGAALFIAFLGLLTFAPRDASGLSLVGLLSLGWLYIPYFLSYVLLIGKADGGRAWIFYLFCVTAAGDAGAFYCGRRLGKHKLYELVSPKKTIEGSMGGLFSSVVVGTLFGFFFFKPISLGTLVLLTIGVALVGQTGDLIESMIKRMSGKKDSSQLLPGHGGLLDRLDSLLFVFPITWGFMVWMG